MGVADGLGGRLLLNGVEDLDGLAHWSLPGGWTGGCAGGWVRFWTIQGTFRWTMGKNGPI